MASWTMVQHAMNAAMWAVVGAYVVQNFAPEMPMAAKLGVLAVVYSYGTDIIDDKLLSGM